MIRGMDRVRAFGRERTDGVRTNMQEDERRPWGVLARSCRGLYSL